ncbi:ribonuclease HII [Elioraea sp.]|jgi:ribonuclease HII|uniref:ribonuclease HII n=1 Tax=Elioraea sp. TaxID=2185103 RepID=UPI00307D1509
MRRRPDLVLELEAAPAGRVAGVDEAGRGPLAGPVFAAAVMFLIRPDPELARRIDDSKRMSGAQREAAYRLLEAGRREGRVAIGVGAASVAEIGRLNILQATYVAMRRAVSRLCPAPDMILVDGHRGPDFDCAVRCVVGGDRVSLSIAAASVVAKVLRDRAMRRLAARWPAYGWAANCGYPTQAHRAALAAFGATPHHRRGFAPVAAALRAD